MPAACATTRPVCSRTPQRSRRLDARGALPCNVKVFIEGEEEIGSPNLERYLTTFADDLAADVFVLADAGQWKVGVPGITWSLRGLATIDVELALPDGPVHSGLHGGAVPDPTMGLARLLDSMVDEYGDIAIACFCDDVRPLTDSEHARVNALPANEESIPSRRGRGAGCAARANQTATCSSGSGCSQPSPSSASTRIRSPAARTRSWPRRRRG